MRSVTHYVIASLLIVLATSCGKKDVSDSPPQTSQSPGSKPSKEAMANVVLTLPQFIAPIEIVVPPDNYDVSTRLDALNGTEQDENSLNSQSYLNSCTGYLGLSLKNYTGRISSNELVPLLTRSGYANVKSYTVQARRRGVTGSNPDGSPHVVDFGVEPRSYTCVVISPQLGPYIGGANVHAGGTVLLGKRKLTQWTFQNTYETPASGKGNVSVFAGTFTYSVDSSLPGFSFNGPGTVTMKMWLDPDNGRWVVDQWDDQAPSIQASQVAETHRPTPPCPSPYSPCGRQCFNANDGEMCGSDGITKRMQ